MWIVEILLGGILCALCLLAVIIGDLIKVLR